MCNNFKKIFDYGIIPVKSNSEKNEVLKEIRKLNSRKVLNISPKILNAFYKSNDSFTKFKRIINRPNYSSEVYVLLKSTVENFSPLKTGDSFVRRIRGVIIRGTHPREITSYPEERVQFGIGRKERLQTTDPCLAGAQLIIDVIEKNSKLRKKYNDELDQYEKDLAKWNADKTKRELYCKKWKEREPRTGWVKIRTSKKAKNQLCEEVCKKWYGAHYKYKDGSTWTEDRDDSWKVKMRGNYKCKISNKESVEETCVKKWKDENSKPVKPIEPSYGIVPSFVCQNCPNTITTDESNLESSVLEQVSNCSIEQTFNEYDQSTNNTSTNDSSKDKNSKDKKTGIKNSEETNIDNQSFIKKFINQLTVAIIFVIVLVIFLILRKKETMSKKILSNQL